MADCRRQVHTRSSQIAGIGTSWIIAASAAWAAGLAVFAWALWTPPAALRGQLTLLQFWSLEICVALGLAVCALGSRDLWRLVDRRHLLGVALPLVVGLGMTVAVVPRTNRIFFDEQIYQSIGQNFADLHRAQICNDGAIENGRLRCAIGEYNKQPYAYPHLLSVAYRAFGVGPAPAFVVNALAIGLSIAFVYLIVALLFADRVAAFFAALLFALTPQQLVWSASAAVEPSASAACLAALLAAVCFVRLGSTISLIGVVVAAAYAIQFRPESLLIVPVIALLIWQRAPWEFTRPRLWWAGVLFLALAAVHVGHTIAVRNEGWGTSQARFSQSYVAANLPANGWFYLGDPRFPAAYSALALLGLSDRRGGTGRLTMIWYFVLFFGMALAFYAGSYNYGADVRYSLATYPPVMILGGLGLARLVNRFERAGRGTLALAGLTGAVVAQFLWYVPAVRATTDGAWAARADVEFARSLVPVLRGRTYVLTQDPGMFQVWGISAGQTSLAAAEPARLDMLARQYPDGVFLHWNFWCNAQDPVQRGFCSRILELRAGDLIREQWKENQRYALYRLRAPASER